jgi:hypothetical protein
VWKVEGGRSQSFFFILYTLLSTYQSFGLFMDGMSATESTIFLELQLIRSGTFIFRRRIIPPLTLRTR